MQLGRFTIEQLSEGQFELFPDGKINRFPVDEVSPTPYGWPAGNSNLAGINPVYITDGRHHILLDAGLGWGLDASSSYTDVSNVATNLDVFKIAPKDITHVILSHLHYDHAAGASFSDAAAATRPTFPRARYIARQAEWNFALKQEQKQSPSAEFYNLDDLYRLFADGYFELIDDAQKEIIPGITIIKTGGHTPGHQIVKIEDEGLSAYYLGDLVPTANQLNQFDLATPHVNRVQVKKAKTNVLTTAYNEGAYLLFYHSIHSKIGQLGKDEDRKFVLKEM